MRVSATRAAPRRPTSAGSFEDFYRGQVDTVYRALALTLNNAGLAREATDEAMLRAYTRWSLIRTYDNPGGWVYRVGLHWATSRWRRTRREQPLTEITGTSAPPDPAGVAARTALAGLSLDYRAVVVARVLLQLTTAETAEVLNLPEGTVKSRLARALRRLRTELRDDDER